MRLLQPEPTHPIDAIHAKACLLRVFDSRYWVQPHPSGGWCVFDVQTSMVEAGPWPGKSTAEAHRDYMRAGVGVDYD